MAQANSQEEHPAEEPVSENIQKLLAHFHQSRQARAENSKAQLRDVLLPRLKQWGVSRVVVEYSGYGDSGGIDGIAYLDANGQAVNMALVKTASDPAINEFAYECLPLGFENNEGGQGTLTIDVLAGTVTIAHSENYTATRDTAEEFTL